MSVPTHLNTKSPTVKRILREASELSSLRTTDYTASPLESNIFEWHFTLRGPPSPSPYSSGLYHGRIILPPSYPLRPPSFRFLTPSGRFEPNREICLSISGHHEESWQPAWGIRTALVAIRAFMESEAKGQVGGVDTTEGVRKRLAGESRRWKCSWCSGKTCDEIMSEREKEVESMGPETAHAGKRRLGGASEAEEELPPELRLGYRDELEKKDTKDATGKSDGDSQAELATSKTETVSTNDPQLTPPTSSTTQPTPTRTFPLAPLPQPQRRTPTNWLDVAIALVSAALGILVLKRLAYVL